MKMDKFDSVIAGAGIAGLIAALRFAKGGYSVAVIDPSPHDEGVIKDQRTTAYLHPSKEQFVTLGLWDGLEKHATALNTMRIIDAGGVENVERKRVDFNASDINHPSFGWNIANHTMLHHLRDAVLNEKNITYFKETVLIDHYGREAHSIIRLSNNNYLEASLLIGADGRDSIVRQKANISVKKTCYGQSALVCTLAHSIPHDNISTEIHREGGPFTLVPMAHSEEHFQSALVWLDDTTKIQQYKALSDAEFSKIATERSLNVLGALELTSHRQIYPIISQKACSLYKERTALIAEAAHVLPPIGAQGLNMSVKDSLILFETAQSHPLGSYQHLKNYARKREADISLRMMGISALNHISQTNIPLFKNLRAKGLHSLASIPPLKQVAIKAGLGIF